MRQILVLLLAVALGGPVVLGQVNLPEGFEIVEFMVSDDYTGVPSLSECGQIVFGKRLGPSWADADIFLYDNGSIVRITDNHDRDVGARINNAGTIVWARGIGDAGVTQLVHLKNGRETILDDNRLGLMAIDINNLGHVAWPRVVKRNCNTETEILLWNGRRTRVVVPHDGLTSQGPALNDFDHMAWGRADFCQNPWVGDIRLYREGKTIVLPSEAKQAHVASINNAGQVAWLADGIEVWENGVTKLLTDWGMNPELNNLGDILFMRWHDELRSTDAWLYRVSDGEPTWHRLTNDPLLDVPGQINDAGEGAWRTLEDPPRGNWAGGVRFLRRIRTGDSQFDGDIDLIDYAAFADCMTGPGRVDRLCDCRFLDIDHDGDVDLGDFALFENAFTGE